MPTKKLPSPVYAAAGAGEALVEQLKKLPSKAEELRDRTKLDERATKLRETVTENVKQGVDTLKHLDREKLREVALETASTLGEKAREAREKAAETYSEFVERGEHVVAGERGPIKVISTVAKEDAKADTEAKVEQAKAEATEKAEAKPATRKPAAKKSTAKKTTTKKATTKAEGAK
ncbi:hypothetical protein [Stackebrandtia nassauensis]|uniref:Heparin-binding hemagglutinin n=1 Tax=Stackebrandtia nassauensis (strain DSM 44728 / CIP 108903 / NRRL B-16338 / NBRC 102104 / LLR-40K-21) TaxID=446470 RepID=D3PTY8_STANL|nr:hypothetical protein [Stackebrandtia nassauensis]ADD39746.1 conserved hypothetical protein [Stackebrandtia nassauensis DSM 44728]